MQAILNYLDKYSAQIFVLQMGLLIILTGIILWVYFYNRKKYHNLKHQIPASVVKDYLDSIIQNSTALKSSLFRGGGLDIDTNGIPSVLPVGKMESQGQVGISLDSIEGDDALKAEVARLQSELADKRNITGELEKKILSLEGTVEEKQKRIEELEALLAEKPDSAATASSDSGLSDELESVKKERDELKVELDEYAMIGDDLADLKRLKQENAQLKSALEPGGDGLDELASELENTSEQLDPDISPDKEIEKEVESANNGIDEEEAVVAKEDAPEEVVAEEASEDAPNVEEAVAEVAEPATEDEVAAPVEENEEGAGADAVVASAANAEEEEDDAPDKSPEDLLSEFEKMLG